MKFVYTEEKAISTMRQMLHHPLVIDSEAFKQYLKNEWFNCKSMWCNCYRQFYHKNIDTTYRKDVTSLVPVFCKLAKPLTGQSFSVINEQLTAIELAFAQPDSGLNIPYMCTKYSQI